MTTLSQYSDPITPPRRSHGCLWGCLAAFLIVAVPIVAAVVYGGWFFTKGYKDEPAMQTVVTEVRQDATLRNVIGDNITVASVDGTNFSWNSGETKKTGYVLTLKGSKGQGSLDVTVETNGTTRKITREIFTTADKRTYDLVNNTSTVPPSSI